jgi:DNA-binding LacI/PurR family transcriptional regulator
MQVETKSQTDLLPSRQLSYDRVRANVLELIRKDKLQPGDRLPSERELSKVFGLNHLTVRKGLAALVNERIIDRRVGAGTFLRTIPQLDGGGEEKTTSETLTQTYIGVLAMPKRGTFANELLGYLHLEAEKRGLQMAIRTVSDLGPKTGQVVRQMAGQGCFAVLLPWMADQVPLDDLSKLVQTSPVPVILTNSLPGLEKYSYERPTDFGRGDYLAIEMACRYFRGLGYGRIAFFGPDTLYTDPLNRRVLSYTRFVSRQGLEAYVGLANSEAADVDRIVKSWSKLAGDLGVVCHDDDFAIRLMSALHKHGLRIPQDVGVLGFNNIPLGNSIDPPLSTIQFDYGYVAGGMLDHALAMARGKSAQTVHEARESLVIRKSCGGTLRAGENLPEVINQAQAVWTCEENQIRS